MVAFSVTLILTLLHFTGANTILFPFSTMTLFLRSMKAYVTEYCRLSMCSTPRVLCPFQFFFNEQTPLLDLLYFPRHSAQPLEDRFLILEVTSLSGWLQVNLGLVTITHWRVRVGHFVPGFSSRPLATQIFDSGLYKPSYADFGETIWSFQTSCIGVVGPFDVGFHTSIRAGSPALIGFW